MFGGDFASNERGDYLEGGHFEIFTLRGDHALQNLKLPH